MGQWEWVFLYVVPCSIKIGTVVRKRTFSNYLKSTFYSILAHLWDSMGGQDSEWSKRDVIL